MDENEKQKKTFNNCFSYATFLYFKKKKKNEE